MKRLRIGLVCAGWSPDPGGVETLSSALAAELQQAKHDVFALALDSRGVLPDEREHESRVAGVRLRRVAWSRARDRSLDDLIRTPRLEQAVTRWVRDYELDLVHIQHLTGWGLGLPARLAELGVPVVLTLHDYWTVCPRGQMLHVDGGLCEQADATRCGACCAKTWPQLDDGGDATSASSTRLHAARTALASCARVFVPSRAACDVLSRSGLTRARLELCENGITVPGGSERHAASGAWRIGVLGAVQPSKGVLELAEWVAELAGFELHVHGPREPYHGDCSYVEELEARSSASDRLHLHGSYELHEVPEILGSLDLVAVPSLWNEVYGLAAREARAAGLPVFASRIGGLAEGDFELLPPGDREAWQVALRRFGSDETWRQSLVESVAAPRSMGEMAAQLEVAYLDVVEQAASG